MRRTGWCRRGSQEKQELGLGQEHDTENILDVEKKNTQADVVDSRVDRYKWEEVAHAEIEPILLINPARTALGGYLSGHAAGR